MTTYQDLIARTYTTLDPHKQETMHAMFAARHVYTAWEMDLLGLRDEALPSHLLPLAREVEKRRSYVSVPAILYAASAQEYDPAVLAAIPHDASPGAVLGALLIDGDQLDTDVFADRVLLAASIVQSVKLAAGMEQLGLSTDNPALKALPRPMTWLSAARLTVHEPMEEAREPGGALAHWHAEWCALAYIAVRDGGQIPDPKDFTLAVSG